MTKLTKNIKCPNCGREYLPAEIFIPNVVFGKPTNVVRDSNGTIMGYDGDAPDYKESYTCDGCYTKFMLTMNVSYAIESSDKSDTHSIPKKVAGLFLEET